MPVSYNPYKVFDYSVNYDADDGINERVELNKNTSVGKEVFLFNSCIQADQRHAITALHHDVEHRNIMNLLKILEDA